MKSADVIVPSWYAAVTAARRPDVGKQFTKYLMFDAAERGLGLAVRFLLPAQLSHPRGELTRLPYRLGSGIAWGGRGSPAERGEGVVGIAGDERHAAFLPGRPHPDHGSVSVVDLTGRLDE